jgi:RNA polymerase sigma factor (sigma-70 family)
MRDDPVVVDLVTRARDGDKAAWDGLVDRYASLIWSICRRHGLSEVDAQDVGQGVWLRLVEHLAELRVPAALPGWIATTTRRECLRQLRGGRRIDPFDPTVDGPGVVDDQTIEEEVLRHERQVAVRTALAELPPRCRRLLAMLVEDPPMPYSEIGRQLDMPVGGIGPNRSRCLDKLRRSPAIAALLVAEAQAGGE